MRFTYAESMTQLENYAPLALAAEAAGYTSMTVADSLIYPQHSDASYPYNGTGERSFLEDKDFLETMVLCTHLAALTSTLRLVPFVLKLPLRHPVLVAKQAAAVACLSGNRLGLGVGLSPWPEDYTALGVSWAQRGRRMDECMDIVRGLTAGGYFSYEGEYYSFPALKQSPVPSEPVPLLVGGHADGALRRAVRRGNGWMHAGGEAGELDRLLARLAQIRAEEGDQREDFEIHVASLEAYDLDGIQRLADKGVTDCIVGFRWPYITGPDTEPLAKKVEHLERYAEKIIARCS